MATNVSLQFKTFQFWDKVELPNPPRPKTRKVRGEYPKEYLRILVKLGEWQDRSRLYEKMLESDRRRDTQLLAAELLTQFPEVACEIGIKPWWQHPAENDGQGPTAASGENRRSYGETEAPINPKKMLTSWREILDALGMRPTDKRKVQSLNERLEGPIPKVRQGSQPIVDRDVLMAWWNALAAKQQELANQRTGKRLSVEGGHEYGRDGHTIPEIGGGLKRRRHGSKKKGNKR